ncbi:NAD(P)-binding protein [Macrolepiota fuliginosa MF-IS2]|uniref:NAD(P)-binding protein n=1 Tax=Macrolepiota fuliginosa MF-IS2 TaxID=1400762 RepID=A0A9P5XJI5_9AGAR|nr:NAD(P)-binding protein [Macrolepiota fuliginosa MF-IS2]
MTPVLVAALVALIYFIWHNDKLYKEPQTAFKQEHWTPQQVRRTADEFAGSESSILKAKDLPPKAGRRYIVVGGTGFLGNCVVSALLRRGEEPENIRIIDLQAPTDPEHLAAGVEFSTVDITDRSALISAFTKPWRAATTNGDPLQGLTVFHCAAVIRYFERHSVFLPRSVATNMSGTRNVIEAAKAAAADILVYTSSGAVGLRTPSLLAFPWVSKRDKSCTQIIRDEGEAEGKGGVVWRYRLHRDFFSNYAETKFRAELLVRNADKANDGNLRTGIVRPGGIMFGPSNKDPVFRELLKHPVNPIWGANSVQNLLYVENCVLAHLLYEQRLLETQRGGKDVGGHAYIIVDSASTISFGDLTMAVNTLTDGAVTFFQLSPTLMYFLSHLVEGYELAYHYLPPLRWVLPRLQGDLIKLQPASHRSMLIHALYDDSLARLPVEKGGLGYKEKVSTLKGVCHTLKWLKSHSETGLTKER